MPLALYPIRSRQRETGRAIGFSLRRDWRHPSEPGKHLLRRWNIIDAARSTSLSAARPSSIKTMALILYQRDNCHLCDLALHALASARVPEFDSIFIDDDTELEARYGAQVPVLRDTERSIELAWPFDARRIAMFLAP